MKPILLVLLVTALCAFPVSAKAADPGLGQPQGNPTHTAIFGVKLQEHCKSAGIECELAYPGASGVKHQSAQQCLIGKLKAPSAK